MMYNGDKDQITVKKWPIASSKVLSDLSIYIIDFFLFERAHSDAVPMRNLFLILSFKGRRILSSSVTEKSLKQCRSNYEGAFQYKESKAYLKERLSWALQLLMLFQTKKQYLTLCRTIVECR